MPGVFRESFSIPSHTGALLRGFSHSLAISLSHSSSHPARTFSIPRCTFLMNFARCVVFVSASA